MYRDKTFLAIIPARSGSKGITDKNIKNLCGKPLIAYTIEAALRSGIFDNIIVSTDSLKYAEISKQYGANVPFLRTSELASDTASSIDVIVETIYKLNDMKLTYDYFILLQPTSPLRNENHIKEAVELLFSRGADSIISVCESEQSPLFIKSLNNVGSMHNFIPIIKNVRRQDQESFYRLNGAIYVCEVNYFLKYRYFYGENSFAYIMKNIDSVDIDENLDFIIAESILKYKEVQ